MFKHFKQVFAVFLFVFLLVTPVSSAQSRSILWQRWDVTIDNFDTSRNSFTVTESYEILFDGRFSFGEAVIPRDNLTDIRNIEVYENGILLTQSCSQAPGTYCVNSVREGISIVYYFRSPITDAVQNFELRYTILGALRIYEGGDQLWWIAVPSEKFGFPVEESTIRVELPEGFGPREGVDPVVSYGVDSEITVNGPIVVATATRRISPNETFEIRVQYPHDPAATPPVWQSSFDTTREFQETVKPILDLVFIFVSAVIAILGPAGVYYLWYSRGRDPKVGPVPTYLSEPPSDLPPAVVGTLLDEKAELRDILSTLIDLARRGYIVIEEDRTEGFFGIGAKTEFTFKRTNLPLSDLRKYERYFVDKLFGGSNRLERSMNDLKNKFYVHIPKLEANLYDELVSEDLFERTPSSTRTLWSAFAVGVLVFAGVIGMIAFNVFEGLSQTLLCLPASIAVGGVALLLASSHMPAKSQKGAEEAAKWNAFREYLSNLQKYHTIEEATPNFERYLPYAVAFGLDRSWIRQFSRAETVPVPTWYYPRYRGGRYSGGFRPGSSMPSASDVRPGDIVSAGGDGNVLNDMAGGISSGLESISDGLTSMLNSASSTLTSRPASSNSSGSWGSGGSSWSGGGSFGGGGSGGGSRGFG